MNSSERKKRNNMRQLISKFHKAKRYLDNTVFMLTFFILGIMVFSVILYLEFYGNSNGTKNDVIGFVSFKTKSIKRKGISNVVWEDANYKGALAIRDTVRSDEGSSGIFTLNDGTDIKLDENSMIILDIKDKTNSIGLLYGTIQANQNSSKNNSLELKSGDLKIKLKGGSINLTKKENSDVEISVSNGEAVIEKKQKEYNLKEDSLFISRKSEEPRLVETYSIPISPENLKSILVSEKESEITFRWKAKENSSKFQLSLKEDFSSLIQEHIVQGEQFKASLPVGIYYWRLMPVIPNSTFYIQTRKFTISEDFIFDYKFPLKSSIFYLQENPVLINFSWNKIDTAKKYSLEVSKSSAFTETIKRLDTEANALSLDFTEEGNYFFRVRASSKNSDHPEKITSIGSFSIKKQNEISKPNLIAPSNEKKSEPFDRVLFGWESNLSYSSYTLTIAENKELTQNLRVITTKNNFSPLENFKMNTEYFWKVEGKTPSGKSISSNVQSFTTRADGEKELVTNQISKRASDNKSNTTRLNIEKRDEKLKKDDVKTISENGKKKEEKKKELEEFAQLTSPEKEKFFLTDKDSFEIPFLWKTRHKKSQIQFSTKEDFSKLYKQEVVKGIRYKTSLPVGIFYWRIVPVDKKTDFLNPVSRRLTIEKDLPIQFQSPKQKSFTIQNKSVSVPFEWDALDAVDKYTLEISKSPSFTSIYKKVDSEFSMCMIDFTEEGIYYFRIRANLNKPTVREKISQAGSLSIFKKVEIVAPVEIKTTKPEKKEEAKAIEIKKEEPKKEIIKEEVKTFPEEKSIPPKLSAPKSQKKTEVEYEED